MVRLCKCGTWSIWLTRKWCREKTIQINTIGTTLIGLLLLGWMRGGRDHRPSPAHLVFLSSREHLYPDLDELVRWSQREDGILRQVCSKDNWPGSWWDAEPNYAISKLLVMYTIEEISRLARGPDGEYEKRPKPHDTYLG
jgi:hypothetical protein